MTQEENRRAIENLLRGLPEVLSPIQIARVLHQSKNLIYDLLKDGEITSYQYRGRYLIAKMDLIDYMLAHTDDIDGKKYKIGGSK